MKETRKIDPGDSHVELGIAEPLKSSLVVLPSLQYVMV